MFSDVSVWMRNFWKMLENGDGMNPEHPKLKPFIHLQFTTLNVN